MTTSRRTEADKTRDQLLAALDKLGAKNVQDGDIHYEGNRVVLPASWDGDLSRGIRYLQNMQQKLEEEAAFVRIFNYRPLDGAAAFNRAMKRVFGTAGQGEAQYSFFGKIPPTYRTIEVGPGQTEQVPWGDVSFSPLSATFTLAATTHRELGAVFAIRVEVPKKYRTRIEGFLDVVEDELKQRSIYRGKAITADDEEPGFLNPFAVPAEKVIYATEVEQQLRANVWTVLDRADLYRSMGMPLKRAFLLEGPYGSGKTLAGLMTAQHAVQNGWTFIQVRAEDDPYQALRTAKLYAPAVVWVEDLDVIAVSGKDRKEIGRLLDVLDGVQAKGQEVMAGFTTNFPDVIEKGVLRPGRIDAVIHIGELDADGIRRVVQVTVPNQLLDKEIDYTAVADAFRGYLPSFAVEAAQRAVRYAVDRTGGEPKAITTSDLVAAGNGLRPQWEMVQAANETGHGKPTMDSQLVSLVQETLRSHTLAGMEFLPKD